MISYISGKIADIGEKSVFIENAGLGYEVLVSQNTKNALTIGAAAKLYTYLNVNSQMGGDGLTLFGFLTKEERAMFTSLTSVSDIGCKTAVGILSGMPLNSLAAAIAMGDVKRLSQIKGIGKKTAERIVLELKEKMSLMSISTTVDVDVPKSLADDARDAIDALRSLGYTYDTAYKAVMKAKLTAKTIEEIITLALKNMGN